MPTERQRLSARENILLLIFFLSYASMVIELWYFFLITDSLLFKHRPSAMAHIGKETSYLDRS